MVLHDLPSGAMDHLERFIDRAGKAGARFHQDFPPDCVPIRSGEIVRSIEPYVSSIEEGTEERRSQVSRQVQRQPTAW
jgi:hypothetical protein